MAIPTIQLSNGDSMPLLGFGTFRLKGKACQDAVRYALDAGYTHFDTADFYDNHVDVGKGLSGCQRESLFLTSKVWHDCLRYDDVLRAGERFLEELNTNYLDLLLIHWPNREVPMEETFSAFERLQDEGLIRAFGVSNFTIRHLETAQKVCQKPVVNNQVEFHPYLYQRELLQYCQNQGIALTAYRPIMKGGAVEDPTITEIAGKYAKTPVQITLKWVIQQGVVAIPGSSSKDHIRENAELFDFELAAEDIERINSLNRDEREVNPDIAEFD